MANGYYGENWEKIEDMIKVVDPILEKFALEKGVVLTKSDRSPGYRAYRWKSDIGRLIEIFLESEEHLTWRMGVIAYEDRKEGRFWKNKTFYMPGPISGIHENLEHLLEECWLTVSSWKSEQLYNANPAS